MVGKTTGLLLESVARSPSGAIRVEKLRATRGSRETRLSREARETRRTQLQATRAADCPKLVKGLSKRGMVSSQVAQKVALVQSP